MNETQITALTTQIYEAKGGVIFSARKALLIAHAEGVTIGKATEREESTRRSQEAYQAGYSAAIKAAAEAYAEGREVCQGSFI